MTTITTPRIPAALKTTLGATICTALCSTALVAATTTATGAAPVSGTYACTAPGLGTVDLPVTVTPPPLPPNIPAGLPVPADLVPVSLSVGVPAGASAALTGLGVTGGTAPDFAVMLGATAIPAGRLALGSLAQAPDGSSTWSGSGKNDAFTTPAPGAYDITMPSTFTISATAGTAEVARLSCVTDAPAPIGSMTVVAQTSTISAKSVRVRKGKRASVPVTVKNMVGAASGSVSLTLGGRSLGTRELVNGKATFVTPVMRKRGVHKVVVRYLGDANTAGSTKRIGLVVTP